MNLTYWNARCLNDSEAYSIREKSKKAVMEKLNELGAEETTIEGKKEYRTEFQRFAPPVKVTVEYSDGLDLLKQCLGEGGIYGD